MFYNKNKNENKILLLWKLIPLLLKFSFFSFYSQCWLVYISFVPLLDDVDYNIFIRKKLYVINRINLGTIWIFFWENYVLG